PHIFYIPLVVHSFPTRRSSDLQETKRSLGLQSAAPVTSRSCPLSFFAHAAIVVVATCAVSFSPYPTPAAPRSAASASAIDLIGRSEEHTSELQSRENIVCRLLL